MDKRKACCGVVLVEFTVVFPFLLLLIFFLLFLATAYNARSGLTHAMQMTRLAITRSSIERVGSDIIPAVTAWDTGELEGYLTTPGLEIAVAPGEYYDQMAEMYFPGATSFSELSPHYVYAHIYILQAMRQTVGPALKAPCDPLGAEPNDGAGCLKCISFGTSHVDPPPKPPNVENDFLGPQHPQYPNFIGIECSYRPDNVLTRLVGAVMSLVVGHTAGLDFVTFTRRAVYYF